MYQISYKLWLSLSSICNNLHQAHRYMMVQWAGSIKCWMPNFRYEIEWSIEMQETAHVG